MDTVCYKLMTKNQWDMFSESRVFRGSEHDIRDGFIHLCKKNQVSRIKDKYFNNVSEVFLVELDGSQWGSVLRYENNSSGEPYPHHYGVISFADVIKVNPF